MNIPQVVTDLIKAQDNFDSIAFSNCFSATATVFDEQQIHKGKSEIAHWIDKANKQYKTVLTPLDYEETGAGSVLSTKVSGTFEGSPIILKYHFDIVDGLIQSLKITG